MTYPCVGTPLEIEHKGVTYYIPHILVSAREGIYAPARLMYDTVKEANGEADKAVQKMIKEKSK